MRVGVPAEVKNHEYRVAITPAGVHELTRQGHDVLVQAGAGTGSSITDDEFTAAGAKIAPSAEDVAGLGADLEGQGTDRDRVRPDAPWPGAVHLPASGSQQGLHPGPAGPEGHRHCVRDGPAEQWDLPLLAPMSEVAGRLAPQVGAYHLMRQGGGRGTLMGGVSGSMPRKWW